MIWDWFKARPKDNLFELLNDDVTELGRPVGALRAGAGVGRLEAMSRAELIALAKNQQEQLRQNRAELALTKKHSARQKKLFDHHIDNNSSAKKLALLDEQREKESQYLRDQFQIRMKELSLRINDLESALLKANTENGLLARRLRAKSNR